MRMPTAPLTMDATIVILVCDLKSMSLVKRVCGTNAKAPMIIPIEATRVRAISSWRSKKSAISGEHI